MNEFVKLMPAMLMGPQLDEQLSIKPEYDFEIRNCTITERLVALQDMYRIFIPSKMSREIYSKLYLSLLRSLQKKSSIFAVKQFHENGKLIRQQTYESIIGGSDCFTVIGPSGIGKSSSVSRAINILTDTPVLKISDTNVIAYLQVQAPADSSVKGLLLEILRKTDEILLTNYHEFAIKSRSTVDMLIGTVSSVALSHIGLLVVDEIQNTVISKNGKVIIGTLTQLINNSGVSICMVGTPECTIFFDQAMMLARRALGLSYTMMGYDEEFRCFCKTLLHYCYVQNSPVVSEEMLKWLYQHSCGNASIVVSLIHDCQEIAILEGIERLDLTTLNIAFEKRMALLHDYITPDYIKAPTLKSKSKNLVIEVNDNLSQNLESVEAIATCAKGLGNDVVSELRKNNFQVIEVRIS